MNPLSQSDSATPDDVGHEGMKMSRSSPVNNIAVRTPSPDVIVEVEASPPKHIHRRLLRSASFPLYSNHSSAGSASTLFLSASSRSETNSDQAPPPPPRTRGVKAGMLVIWEKVINSDYFIIMLVDFGYNWLQANTLQSYSPVYDAVLGFYIAVVVVCWCRGWTAFLTKFLGFLVISISISGAAEICATTINSCFVASLLGHGVPQKGVDGLPLAAGRAVFGWVIRVLKNAAITYWSK